MICLVNSDNERDLNLLISGEYAISFIGGLVLTFLRSYCLINWFTFCSFAVCFSHLRHASLLIRMYSLYLMLLRGTMCV
ncbi:hypothetical protein [Plasmodium yoelii yoelii]|uniref:Uncharacterized protein n=1 Tax=Plasmodium yoelii yoelii TaxID=73239 RepID=Q7RAM5_PLAYO|nr:hypothetical protein [Plasmodium yoelii yoelii]